MGFVNKLSDFWNIYTVCSMYVYKIKKKKEMWAGNYTHREKRWILILAHRWSRINKRELQQKYKSLDYYYFTQLLFD